MSSWLDGEMADDEREVVYHVAEWLEMDCLSLLKGRVMTFVLFLTVFLSDAALPEIIDDFVDMVSADLAIVRNSDPLPLLIQSDS